MSLEKPFTDYVLHHTVTVRLSHGHSSPERNRDKPANRRYPVRWPYPVLWPGVTSQVAPAPRVRLPPRKHVATAQL